jgi:hypothetical protein
MKLKKSMEQFLLKKNVFSSIFHHQWLFRTNLIIKVIKVKTEEKLPPLYLLIKSG